MIDRAEQYPRIRYREREDLSGQKINYLTVIEPGPDYINPSGDRFTRWVCKCDCGKECIKRTTELKSGKALSCGCMRSQSMKNKYVKDLTGQKFGRWTVLKRDTEGVYKDRVVRWICECECGTVKTVSGASLRRGDSVSCGCAKIESLLINRDLVGEEFGHLLVLNRAEDEYKYHRNNKMWHCRCICGNEVNVREADLLSCCVQSCGCAGTSLNELYFAEILDKHNIPYETEIVFTDCVGDTGRSLRFDFKIEYNNETIYVELNGKQHYSPVGYFGGTDTFLYQQQLDVRKRAYMQKTGKLLLSLDCSNRPSKKQLETMFLDSLSAIHDIATDLIPILPVNTGSNRNVSQFVRYFNFKQFYKHELELWNNNNVYKNELTLQEYLLQNREKYLNKSRESLSVAEIMRGFKISGIYHGYSMFDVSLLSDLFDKYKITSVYDPCAGWGERMLSCYFNDVEYLGVDINSDLSEGYLNMMSHFNMSKQNFIINDSSKFNPGKHYDAILTCPPYWNTEIYSDKGAENLSYDDFLKWWDMVVDNCKQASPTYFCFQINQKYRDDLVNIVLQHDFDFVEEQRYKDNKSSHFNRKLGTNTKKEYESLLIFKAH